jgi:hypothetical protein
MHPSRRLWDLSIIILLFVGALVALSRSLAELDLWGHVRWGLDTLNAGQLLRDDPYSYLTAGQTWISHEWLGSLSLGLAWETAGSSGLLLLKLAAWLLVFILPLAWLLRSGAPPLRAGILVLLALPILTAFSVTIRPQMYTALGYSLTLLALQQAEAGRPRWLWILPPVFLAWANLHGAFLLGLGLLWVWAVIYLLSHRRRAVWLQVLPPVLLSGLVTLINPYGMELWTFLLSHLAERRLEIAEWQPLTVHSRLGLAYLAWLGLCVAGLVFTRQRRSPALLALLAICAYLPMVSARHLLFFQLSALWVAGPHLLNAWQRFMPVPDHQRPVKHWVIVIPLLAALLMLLWKPPNLKTIPFPSRDSFPVGAVELLAQSGVAGNLAVHFDWGNYVAWRLAPQVLVSVDTRREMAYPSAAYQANLRFMLGVQNWSSLLDEYPTDLALVKRGDPPDNLLRLYPGWELIYQDELSALYARRGTPQADRLRQAAQGFKLSTSQGLFP